MKHTSIISLLFLTLVLLIPESLHACTCIKQDPAEAFNKAAIVFVGKLLDGTEEFTTKYAPGKLVAGRLRFKTSETFKGSKTDIIQVQADSMRGTSCGDYGLEVGKEYVVYAYQSESGILYTGVCSRTAEIDGERAQEDLKFLRNLPAPGSGGEIDGRVWADLRSGQVKEMPNVWVKITRENDSPISITTNSKGEFQVTRAKAGDYTVEVMLPKGYTTEETTQKVKLDDRGKATSAFELYRDGSVTGRIVDVDGKPFNSILLHLVDGRKNIYGNSTEENGGFEVYGVPPGRYLLHLTLESENVDRTMNYYYPGTFDRSKAKVLVVGDSQEVGNLEFKLPPNYKVRTIEGRVLWADGTPAADAEVDLLCPKSLSPNGYTVENSPTTTKTDTNGNFKIEGFIGESYWLEARGSKQQKPDEVVYYYSPDQPLQISADVRDITLKLSKVGYGGGCSK